MKGGKWLSLNSDLLYRCSSIWPRKVKLRNNKFATFQLRWSWFMVFNATTFNNISVISWQSVVLVEETGVPWEKHRSATSQRQTLYHIMLYRLHLIMNRVEITTLVSIGTDWTGGCKSNYHTTTTTPNSRTINVITKLELMQFCLIFQSQVKGNLHLNEHQNAGWSIQTARVDKNGTGIQIDGVPVDTKNRMN